MHVFIKTNNCNKMILELKLNYTTKNALTSVIKGLSLKLFELANQMLKLKTAIVSRYSSKPV